VVDFFDFLPILRQGASVIDAVTELTAQYAHQGRFNVVSFGLLSAKYALFGESMLGWQLFRFAEMSLACVLLHRLLLALGASQLGAIAASGLFVLSPSAAVNWLRLTASEASGTVLLLILMLLLVRSSDRSATPWLLVLLAAVTLTIGLLKELLLTAVVVPALALHQFTSGPDARGIRVLIRSRRLWAIAVGGVAAAVPVLFVAARAPSGAYTSEYAFGNVDVTSTVMPLVATLLPFAADDGVSGRLVSAAVVLFLLIIVMGWGLLLSPASRTRARFLLLGLGLGLPLSGALAYAPWPGYALMYALPFQIGTAVLLAFAMTALRDARTLRSAPGFAIILPLAVMVSYAHQYSRFIDRSLHMSHDVASYLGTLAADRPVVLEVCPGLRPSRWAGFAPILRRYAESMGVTSPHLRAAECSSHVEQDAPSALRIVLSDRTVGRSNPQWHRSYVYRAMNWETFRAEERALVVTTFAGQVR
jgi:hypothetical protein